jgi:hypothetical protein
MFSWFYIKTPLNFGRSFYFYPIMIVEKCVITGDIGIGIDIAIYTSKTYMRGDE